MPHFVTAAAGEPHVTSTDTAHYNAGTLGPGCYVLPLRDRMACTMVDSNTLRILAGDAVVCGRQWAIEGDYEELNIDNGVPGYNRIDLVVCRIEIGENETIELKVYKGEETTGTPVVPGHVEGDLNDGDTVCEMPICSVRINGINPQAPEMLAKESIDIMTLLEELRDYKSQTVGTAKLADLAVTQAKLAASSVTGSKMADNSVTSAKIADGAVTTADLAAKAVTSAKLADAVWGWQAVGAVSDIGTLYRWGRLGFVEVYCKKTAALAGWKSISGTLPGGVRAAFVARSRLTCEDKPGYECTGRVSDNIFYLENRSSTDWPASSGFYVTGSVVFVIA